MARPRDPSIDVRVIESCVELLDEVGRAGLTRARIAERAGVSLPAVNRRFAGVDEIVLAISRTPPRPAPGAPSLDDATSLRDFLTRSLVRTALSFAAGPVRRPAAELLAVAAGDELVDDAFQETLDRVREVGRGWVEHARAAGEVRLDVDAEALLDAAAGAAYYRLLWRGEALDTDDAARLVDLLLLGAAPR
ncbi:MAG: TetR/AcrR family transcriptional regulator C-terminal ligand-binding domain-containing protein [Nocardioidaceae bacterium]|nr:TetR/AcrR family transcriptional regulator C-terminal ligand-binding domain-containing protein [Nocardioidaceae bacterium]